MSWWTTIFIALLSGIFGLFCAGAVAAMSTRWYTISDAAGRGMFVVYTALLGGIASGIIAVIASRIIAAGPDPGFLKGLGWSCLAVLTISLLALLLSRWQAHVPPKIAGHELMLEVEMRLPAGDATPPDKREGTPSFRLGSAIRRVQRKSRQGEIHMDRVRQENGRWIIPASVFLFTTRGMRSIHLYFGDDSAGGFIVPLPGRPRTKHEQWSEWGPIGRPGHPWPETKTSFRFRVQRILPGTAQS